MIPQMEQRIRKDGEVSIDNPDNNNTEDGLDTTINTTGDNNIPTTDGEDSNVIKLKVGEPFSKEYNLTAEYTLIDAPKGMRILENGYLTWTPSKSQIKDYNITILNGGINFDEINISVEDNSLDINGYLWIYLSPAVQMKMEVKMHLSLQ